MAKTKSSKRWLKEHFSDPYVEKAKLEGYRSRAAYKLLEIHEKHTLFLPGMTVVDLGAAPGGWSQVAKALVGAKGRVFALDRLTLHPIPGVTFLQGDFTELTVLDGLMKILEGQRVDIVLSDMAPNMTGISSVDQLQSTYLVELALDFACQTLVKGGILLCKLFHGKGFDDFVMTLRKRFLEVKMCKPAASRRRSSEVYALARGFKAD